MMELGRKESLSTKSIPLEKIKVRSFIKTAKLYILSPNLAKNDQALGAWIYSTLEKPIKDGVNLKT